ncbi:MAG: sulfatase-like hydrolase/transferase [Verrucomicrobia bacterium]|nr:sulfatase-like hydrolase/transferase [Verrucomicrobiota bacterium]
MKMNPPCTILFRAALGLALTAVAGAAPRPNVLFIAVDDLRPELGCYGNRVVSTPNIDRLAARGIVFTRAYCQQAVCSPTRSSLLTGRRPDATRVWDLETHFRVALPEVVTLPQYFKANGYHCAALSKIYHHGFEDGRSWSEPHWYPNGSTIDTDPADWSKRLIHQVGPGVQEHARAPLPADNDQPNAGKPGKAPKGPAFEVSHKSDDELPDGFTAAEAVKRLHELKTKGQPFFLAVGFLKPHLPFVAPKKYWDRYDPNKIPLPAIDHLPTGAPAFAGHDNGELHSYANVPAGNPIPADFARTLRHGYYACISYTDAQVGRLLEALQKEGLADNTVVVLWGDHGWQLGDHGLWHKHTNFELATRVPLLLSLPRQQSAGQQCEAPVEFVDVYPTLADVCGLPIPSGLDGVSLKPFVETPTRPGTKVAISQYPRGGAQTGGMPLMGYSIRDERWRLTLWRERNGSDIAATELYDERNDPAESTNLAAANPEVVIRLSAFLPPPIKAAPTKPNTSRAAPAGGDRAAMFERRDNNHDGKLSREEFLGNQPDPAAARLRFDPWDTDKDGFLSREEFVFKGGQPQPPPMK